MADADRELLELAAKAAGMSGMWFANTAPDSPMFFHQPGKSVYGVWNPLTDDGDALRLAAHLGISITPYPIYNSEARHSVIAKQRRKSDTLREANPTEVLELCGDDPAAAWRRVIVRCAAQIGRAA